MTGHAGGGSYVPPVVVFPDTIAVTGCSVVDGDLYFGSYDGRLWRLPADERASGKADEVAQLPGGVTDIVLGPEGVLYIATTDAIFTMEPLGGNAAVPSASATPTSAASSPSVVAAPGRARMRAKEGPTCGR